MTFHVDEKMTQQELILKTEKRSPGSQKMIHPVLIKKESKKKGLAKHARQPT